MRRGLPLLSIASLALLPLMAGAAAFGPAQRVEGIDSVAMAVDIEGDRLYVAAGTKLSVLSVSNPLKPVRLGEFEGVDNRRQLVVRNSFAYVVSRETGLRIVDCTDPKAPRLRSRFDSVEFATGIEVVGRTAFLSERINGVEVVDVSDPDRPAHVAIRKTSESQSARYRDGYLYSGEWGASQVTVFDMRDLKAIREVGRVDLFGYGDGLDISGRYLYCSTGHDSRHRGMSKDESVGRGRGLDIFDLADPAHPKRVGRADFPRFVPRNDDYWTVRVSGRVAFCADSHNGLFAVDVSDPSAPKVVDRFCVPQSGHPDWPSAAVSSLAVGRDCLYVTVNPGGLYVVPLGAAEPVTLQKGAEPAGVGWREPYPTDGREFAVFRPAASGQARTACVCSDLVYAAFGDAGLQVVRVGVDGELVKVGELPGRKVYDCAFSDGRLLTAEGVDGFALYELDGPTGFREVARRPRLSSGENVAFWVWAFPSGLSVLTGRNGGLRFVRTGKLAEGKDLANMHFSCNWDKYLADRPLDGLIPVARPGRELIWLDVSRDVPRQVRRDPSVAPRQTNGICAFGDDLFLATEMRRFTFVGSDGTVCGEPREFPGLNADMRGGGVPRSDGRLVALTARSAKRAALYDFRDRANPRLVRNWTLSGNPDLAAFLDGRVVIPAGHQGLLVTKERFGRE